MARHRAGYSGELLSEKLTVKMTESEKEEAAKKASVSRDSAFDLRAYATDRRARFRRRSLAVIRAR